jgi:hypothetical protein
MRRGRPPSQSARPRGAAETPDPLSGAGLDPAAYDRHVVAIAVTMNLFFVRHLIETYRAFDGDVVEAIVLGEIGHHNLAALRPPSPDPHELSARLIGHQPATTPMLPTNAFSIAQATGIPRETVRRKVAQLARRGWITRDSDGNLFVTDRPLAHFAQFNRERCADLVRAAGEIRQLADARPVRSQPTSHRHPRPSRRRP